MTEDLCAPDFADEIIVLQDAAMRLEFCTGLQGDDEVFVTQTHQLSKVTVARDRSVEFE